MTKNDPLTLTTKLEENLLHLRERFVHSEDFIMEYLHLQDEEAYIVYIETIIDKKLVQERILNPLKESRINYRDEKQPLPLVKETNSMKEITQSLLEGSCIVLSKDSDLAYVFNVPFSNDRKVKEPETEGIIRGAHDGFVESLSTNISLIRKRIHNSNLKVKYFSIGNDSHTKVALIYLDHIAK
ncbi:spore germination protein [Bacillus sp. m3-13]|uniref:spore germination protein n=1 Tax=Bacillus sp. m3-13 TaxID=406124 RepID=UPI0002FD996C|nr:spore germination protein [Bacillus sp. m3-13]